MRARPNLAARPFVDSRPVLLASIALTLVALGLSALTAAEFLTAQGEERALAQRLEDLNGRRAELISRVQRVDAALREVKWKDLERETASLAKVVAARNLSWSRMLADLERTLPWDTRLVTVAPQVHENGSCEVTLAGYASGRAAWLSLLGRLFAHERFGSPVPLAEEAPGPTNALGHKFQLKALYWPGGKP
ncbi:MAG: hypothetical protein HXY19_04255 [Thermoanaerobaculaceae bacterium]|nr:hypothetical protein [Thermoanaerobaculaceae bacterium]